MVPQTSGLAPSAEPTTERSTLEETGEMARADETGGLTPEGLERRVDE